ncbi:phage tail tape measure protein [Pseudomonas fluorescens]|uniref:phage tail tape measure protein n=1 Tax=Pseudomonas fluorescens TaxID=294 RepID=UPI003C2799CA
MADKFQLKALITGVDKLSPTLAGIRKNVAGFRKGLERTGLGKIGFSDVVTGGALAAPFIAGAAAAIEFESALADVKKVVNFDAPGQFKQMGDDISKMSERLPMAATDIAKIVAAGGQSGIAREELLGFAEAAVKMGIAFDQSADESGSMMATWRTAFKMTQTDVVGLADRINYLGNTGPANTKQISAIVTEVGSLGEVAGLSSGQIAALGATMAGVGVKQDVAATGIKNFMLAMTKGSAATKSQTEAYKALRLDSKSVAVAMQKDAQGTMLDLLKRISQVDKAKRPALLTNLFGSESISAITPLLTNLELLESNLQKVGDASKYAGSMDTEYASRAATTANNLQLLRNAAASVVRAVGNALLPGINAVVDSLRPMISTVAELVQANPQLVKGLAIAGAAFTALRIGVYAATVATRVLGVAFAASPVGIIAVAIAAAAGLIMANWDTVGPFFTALWELIKALATPFMDFMKTVFDWSPLGMIIKHWSPITDFFKGLWEGVKPYLQPILSVFGLEEGGTGLTAKVASYAEEQRQRNAGVGGGTGAFLQANAVSLARNQQTERNLTQAGLDPGQLLRQPVMPAPGALLQQGAANNRAQLEGGLVMRFENAPPGFRVDPGTSNQPGLSITPKVGYRTLGSNP